MKNGVVDKKGIALGVRIEGDMDIRRSDSFAL